MLINKTKNSIIAKNVKYCKNPLQKAIGLMFSKELDKPLIFSFNREKRISVHMLFVFFPIDIIWLSRDKKVVYVKESAKPFAIVNPKIKSKYIIELAKGFAKRYKIEKGDEIEF